MEAESRKGDWIQTSSGKAFWPLDPRLEDISISDIAQSLSMKCRFNGHCRGFYTVADHSVRVARYLMDFRPWDKKLHLWGLLHDAAEAYTCDVPRPLKPFLVGFKEIEDNILSVIAEKFDLPFPIPKDVKLADNILLATETRDLMGHGAFERWGRHAAVPLEKKITTTKVWWKSRDEFLSLFNDLTKDENESERVDELVV